jgi:hypothetical protein
MTLDEYKDIAPYDDCDFAANMAELVKEPGFEHAVKYVMPTVDYPTFTQQLLSINSKNEFQRKVMVPFLEMLASKTSASLTMDGLDNCPEDSVNTFISNHRDIVLDPTFLNLGLLRNNRNTGEIALGDNLLIYPWIEKLVKLNKGLIVKRNLKMLKAFAAAKQLSGYIHYCINDKNESVWIAQREGRAKDSNDCTQEGVLKMLALAGDKSPVENLMEINICPVTISYEFDPNDYLKASEFLLKRRDPEHTKSQHDDLLSMETGLLGFKGRIHYHISPCINTELSALLQVTDKNELFQAAAAIVDRHIHLGYKIYPINYISYDIVNSSNRFEDCYTDDDKANVKAYIEQQLAKVRVENITDEERQFMRDLMLKMYSNPLKNKLIAEGK